MASTGPNPASVMSRALPSLYRIASLAIADHHDHAAQVALTAIMEALGAQGGALLLINPDRNRLEVESHQALSSTADQLSFEIGQGLPGWVALHAQPVLAPDVTTDSRYP